MFCLDLRHRYVNAGRRLDQGEMEKNDERGVGSLEVRSHKQNDKERKYRSTYDKGYRPLRKMKELTD